MTRRATITGRHVTLFKATPKGRAWNRCWPDPIDCGTDARAHVAKRLWEKDGVVIRTATVKAAKGDSRQPRLV
jgi:hypothetical protein